ncbi:MAG TPA: SDR family NAD(P)-dependent oxidoreductase [Bacteroidota bacterium]|nr:SDR family NAD(P)-dependent oxidoreductase [Bacteroidota bacterium]
MISLHNQIALITGGSRGIGAATALLFAEAGADVAITYQKDNRAADAVCRKVEAFGVRAIAVKGSIEKYADCKRMIGSVMKAFGKIDILVNSAGIWEYGEIGGMTEKEWNRTIAINLNGTFNMCNLVVPLMKRRKYGRIVNVASTAGQRGEVNHSHYAASKGGIIAFTKSLGAELISKGIWVNCVAPGWVDTDMTSAELRKGSSKIEILRTIPRQKVGTPEEIAGPILFLASDLANNVVGEILNANGGSVLCG